MLAQLAVSVSALPPAVVESPVHLAAACLRRLRLLVSMRLDSRTTAARVARRAAAIA
jgi:hypothetical protein